MSSMDTRDPPRSKYAKKKEAEEQGLRPLFEFKDKQLDQEEPPRQVVSARVVRMKLAHNCAFLETETGEEIFLSLKVLRRDLAKDSSVDPDRVDVGWTITCIAKENTHGVRGISVCSVLSVAPLPA